MESWADWAVCSSQVGHIEGEPSRNGTFPANYVHKLTDWRENTVFFQIWSLELDHHKVEYIQEWTVLFFLGITQTDGQGTCEQGSFRTVLEFLEGN